MNVKLSSAIPLLRTIGALAIALALVSPAQAQVLYGTLLGNVTDPSGSSAPGAEVVVRSLSTGRERTVQTDGQGFYALRDLQGGEYDVAVTAPGFSLSERSSVEIRANVETRVDFQLALESSATTVEVSAYASALQTDRADTHSDISSRQIQNLPLSGYRNYQSLLDTVPGATPTKFQNAMIDSPARSLTTNINGSSRNTNNTRIDGATSTFPYLPHHTLYNPPAEAIETVNVTTNSFAAEQGIAGGAAITVITKSGTNDLHGVAFEHHNNATMNARNFFYLKPDRQKNILNQFGGTLGGPIVRNKLFYFGSYEGMRQRQEYSTITSVPTPGYRAGDFNGLASIYDPLTGDASGRNRQAFANDTIPTTRLDPAALRLQELLPLPNLSGTANNYFVSGGVPFDRHNVDAKVNWNVDDRSTLFGKYSVMDATVQGEPSLGAAFGSGLVPGGGSGKGHTLVQVVGVGFTRAFTPAWMFDANFGFSRLGQNVLEQDYGVNYGLDLLGIPGTNGPTPRESGMPSFAVSGFPTFGNPDAWTPAFRNDNVFTYVANVAYSSNGHNLRFGMDLNNTSMSDYQPQRGFGPRGGFTFAGGVTGLNGGAAPTQANSYAAYLLGLPASLGKSYQNFNPMTVREWQSGLYAQDQWQATRTLTITLGLRWEYYPIIRRADGRGIERYDLTNNMVYLGCIGGVPCNAGTQPGKNQWAPRAGLAWRMNPKSVARAGFGISRDPYPFSRAMRDPYPVTIAQTINSSSSYTAAGTLAEGIPALDPIDLSSGVVELPLDAYTKTLLPGNYNRGYVESFNFTLERQLPGSFVASAAYVGTRSIRQTAYLEMNAGQVPGAGSAGRPLNVLFGRNASTQAIVPFQTANYNSLQATLNRRYANGVVLTTSYTYSKSIDYNTDGDSGLMFNAQSALERNRAVSNFDRTHMFVTSIAAELPFGKGKPWLNQPGVARAVLGGWQVNSIFSAYTGLPYTVTASATSLNAPGNTQVADQVKAEVATLGGVGSNPWFDTSAFAAVRDVRFGNSGRNTLRGPHMVNLNLGLFRRFTFAEKYNLELRGELFNLTNTPPFNNPNASVGSGSYGYITSTVGGPADSRVIRVSGRLSF
ncbi:MAG: TonB-dependent receptor plug domain-containing protein [Acidobacteria bacterium]|nr:TonB-dependent receptor plug domain-containing protein [Acidobacteriota bacterium]